MTPTITKPEAEALIEKLADKTLSFGCILEFTEEWKRDMLTFPKGEQITLVHRDTKYEHEFMHAKARGTWGMPNKMLEKFKNLGHPILIGTVLDIDSFDDEEGLLYYWQYCGYSKSLQEIVGESGWEALPSRGMYCTCKRGVKTCVCGLRESGPKYVLKCSKASVLLSFIKQQTK